MIQLRFEKGPMGAPDNTATVATVDDVPRRGDYVKVNENLFGYARVIEWDFSVTPRVIKVYLQ